MTGVRFSGCKGTITHPSLTHTDRCTRTRARFPSSDCRRLISISGDGCIFAWRLGPELTAAMRGRLTEMGKGFTRTGGRYFTGGR